MRSVRTIHLVDPDVVIGRTDAEEDSSGGERRADHLSLSGPDFFVVPRRRVLEHGFVELVVVVLPENDKLRVRKSLKVVV